MVIKRSAKTQSYTHIKLKINADKLEDTFS